MVRVREILEAMNFYSFVILGFELSLPVLD